MMSLPMRGAWIEIVNGMTDTVRLKCRSPCGERGLKSELEYTDALGNAVAPHAGSVD